MRESASGCVGRVEGGRSEGLEIGVVTAYGGVLIPCSETRTELEIIMCRGRENGSARRKGGRCSPLDVGNVGEVRLEALESGGGGEVGESLLRRGQLTSSGLGAGERTML